MGTGVAAGHSRWYAISFAINKLAVGPAIAITAGMGIIQLFLTFLVDGLRAALAAALLIGWPIIPGSCGAVSQQAGVTSNVDAIVVPCAPVEIRFRFEESGLTPRVASRTDRVPADTHSIARPTRWNTRFEVRIENSFSVMAVDRDQ